MPAHKQNSKHLSNSKNKCGKKLLHKIWILKEHWAQVDHHQLDPTTNKTPFHIQVDQIKIKPNIIKNNQSECQKIYLKSTGLKV